MLGLACLSQFCNDHTFLLLLLLLLLILIDICIHPSLTFDFDALPCFICHFKGNNNNNYNQVTFYVNFHHTELNILIKQKYNSVNRKRKTNTNKKKKKKKTAKKETLKHAFVLYYSH